MKTRRIRPCQFCGKHSPATPKHEGKFLCEGHQVQKREWQEGLERDAIADVYSARAAARRAEEGDG